MTTQSNALFASFKVKALSTTVSLFSGPTVANLDSETAIKCVLIDIADTAIDEEIESTYQDLADVSTLAFVPATPQVMTGTSVITSGTGSTITFDADDVTFTSVTGDTAEQVLLYHETGTTANNVLICKFGTATGLPVTPNGGNIVVQWNTNGIFTW